MKKLHQSFMPAGFHNFPTVRTMPIMSIFGHSGWLLMRVRKATMSTWHLVWREPANHFPLCHSHTWQSSLRQQEFNEICQETAAIIPNPMRYYNLHSLTLPSWLSTFTNLKVHLPVDLLNSSRISSLPFDFGMLPTKSRRFGTLMFTFRLLLGLIS